MTNVDVKHDTRNDMHTADSRAAMLTIAFMLVLAYVLVFAYMLVFVYTL